MRQFVPVTVLVAILSCARSEQPAADSSALSTTTASAPNVVNVVGTDFAYQSPDTVPAGMTTIRFESSGSGVHHVTLVRLQEGKTWTDLEAFMKAMKPGTAFPSWFSFEGGPQPVPPGEVSEVTQMLEAGNYALLCFVDVPDHIPHFAKGMMRPLTVVPSSATAAAPTADVTITMSDYTWTFSKPLTAGRQVVKFENTAAQPHELILVKLHEGKTPDDLGKWATTFDGPPPGTFMGGLATMRAGAISYAHLNLTAGNYVALCFVPDAKDGKIHAEHGMVLPFTI